MSDTEHGHGAGAEASLDKHPSEATGIQQDAVEPGPSPARRADTATELRGSVSWLLRVFPAGSYHLKGQKNQPHTPLKICQLLDETVCLSDLLISES